MSAVHYTVPLIITAAISTGLALYSRRRHLTAGVEWFASLMLAVSVWSLSYALELNSDDLPGKLFWSKVEYLSIVAIPTLWLAFALQYTGREKWLTRRNYLLLTIEPIITLLLVWTNEFHGLIWKSTELVTSGSFPMLKILKYGPFFPVHVAYSYVLLALGTWLLALAFIRSPKLYRRQVAILLVGLLAPWVGNALYLSRLSPFPGLDLTPFGYTLTGLAVIFGLFQFRLLDIVPVARDAVIAAMPDGMIVLDAENRIIDLNPAARRIIGRQEDVIGQPVVLVLSGRSDVVDHFRETTEARGEIVLGGGQAQGVYDLRTSLLHDRRGRLTGRMVMLHDITERKEAEEALEAQRQLFEDLVTVARATTEYPTLETTLQNALNVTTSLTDAERSGLLLLDEAGVVTNATLTNGEGTPIPQPEFVGHKLDEGISGWVAQNQQPVLIHDVTLDDRQLILLDTPSLAHSVLAVPIILGQVMLGVLILAHSTAGHFSDEHLVLMQAAAGQMALALRNAQIYEEQRRLANRQATLYEVLRTVGAYLDPEAVARVAVVVVARMTDWPIAAVLLPEESGTGPVTRLIPQADAGELSSSEKWDIDIEKSVVGRAFRTGETQYVPDVSLDPDYVAHIPAVRSMMAIPLRRGGRVLGVLDIESDALAAFDGNDILLAESLAEAIALAMDNARLHTEMRQNADDLGMLYEITRIVSQSLVLEDVLSETLSSALASLDLDAGLVSLTGLTDGRLYLAAERGLPPAFRDRLQQEGLDETLCAYVHRNKQGVLAIGDIEQGAPSIAKVLEEVPAAINNLHALGMRAYVGIPLSYQERSLGMLSLFARQPRDFSTRMLAQQMAIGQQIAAAVANARLFQSIADERSQLHALIESSRDGIILIGMDRRALVVNATAIDFLHLGGRPDDWVDRFIQDTLGVLRRRAPAAAKATLAEMRRIQRGDEPFGEGEYEVPPRQIHWLNLPVISGTTPLGRLLVLRDVTEERLVERMRDDLTRTLVHDLRNPLTSISVSLDLMNKILVDTASPTQKQMMDIARQNTEKVLELVNAILDISRMESGQMPLEKSAVSLGDIVAGVVESQLPLVAEKGLRLDNEVSPDLAPVYVDAALIERVLRNLIGNAIKFTSTGDTIRVAARAGAPKAPYLFVSVSDTGPGIPPDILERLFQKFVTGQQEERGSGLGLAFCKMVIEAHGERIWVESPAKGGTTFTFTLPLLPRE